MTETKPEPVSFPTVESVEKDIAEKTEKYRRELKHLRALLRVAEDREGKE